MIETEKEFPLELTELEEIIDKLSARSLDILLNE